MKLIYKAPEIKPKLTAKYIINRMCPSDLGFEPVQNYDQYCCKITCEACWDREG